MTSVFGGLFVENLRRVDKCSTSRGKSAQHGSAAGENFARVLAEVEDLSKKNSINRGIASKQDASALEAKGSSGQVLSNLSATENTYQRASLKHPETLSLGHEFAREDNVERNASSVKQLSSSVKTMPPMPILPEVKQSPLELPAPIVVSAKRLDLGKPSFPTKITGHFKKHEIKEIVVTAGRFHGVDPALTLAVAQAESSYERHAVSSDGHYSKGVFQLLDSTGKDMMQLTGLHTEAYDPFDPGQNAFLGVGYLRRLMDIFSKETRLNETKTTSPAKSSQELEKLAVAAYNAGEGTVVAAQQRALAAGEDPGTYQAIEKFLPETTRDYVHKVGSYRLTLAGDFPVVNRA